MLVRRRVHRDNAEVSAPLLEEAVDVHGLCIGLDGDGRRSLAMLGDVSEELIKHVGGLRFGLHEVRVSVAR
jgi:hypothetical protein